MAGELLIQNGSKAYIPVVEDEIEWSTERAGVPGKLTFKVHLDSKLDITEGLSLIHISLGYHRSGDCRSAALKPYWAAAAVKVAPLCMANAAVCAVVANAAAFVNPLHIN